MVMTISTRPNATSVQLQTYLAGNLRAPGCFLRVIGVDQGQPEHEDEEEREQDTSEPHDCF